MFSQRTESGEPSQGTYGSPETPPLKENKLMLT